MGEAGTTICIVKDDPFLRVEAVLLLEEAGLSIVSFADAESAMAHLARSAEQISLLVIEIRFPGRMTGLELARRVARRWPQINVALMALSEPVAKADIPESITVAKRPWLPTDLLVHAHRANTPR